MKSLLVIRHAKSSWDNLYITDFERSLNDRGRSDAPAMASRLLDKKITIDLYISSPAKRARETAELFLKEVNRKKSELILEPALYEATVPVFYKVVQSLNPASGIVAIFSHNPGITEFINGLTTTKIPDMPTCSVFAIKIDTGHWLHFDQAEKDFWFFDYPKQKSF